MRMYESASATILAALLVIAAAGADAEQAADQPAIPVEDGFVTLQEPGQMLASNLMGADVAEQAGEVIGTVDDLLIDEEGRVLAVVVGIGGFLGIGQKDIAVPVEALRFDLAHDPSVVEPAAGADEPHSDASAPWAWGQSGQIRRVIVDVAQADLADAPDFTRLDE